MMVRFYIAILMVLTVGCTHAAVQHADEAQIQAKKIQEEEELSNAEAMLAKSDFDAALKLFRDFQKTYPQSYYFQASRIGEARAFEGKSQWAEAIAIDRDVYLKTIKLQPEIAASAMYRSSYAQEALGDDEKTIAALIDAQRMSSYLPLEVAKAEIPARLASVYARIGRDQEALTYVTQADKGIQEVRETKKADLKTDWLAKTYFEMGSISTNQLSNENFGKFVSGQKMVQVYLLKAMSLEDSLWAERSSSFLKTTYQNLYSQMDSEKKNQNLRNEMGANLIDLISQAELFKPLNGQDATESENEFFTYLAEVRKKTEQSLYEAKPTMPLTAESEKLNGVQRPGRVKADQVLPQEEKSIITSPPKVVPTEDPNL